MNSRQHHRLLRDIIGDSVRLYHSFDSGDQRKPRWTGETSCVDGILTKIRAEPHPPWTAADPDGSAQMH
jgi:hypothetical protein